MVRLYSTPKENFASSEDTHKCKYENRDTQRKKKPLHLIHIGPYVTNVVSEADAILFDKKNSIDQEMPHHSGSESPRPPVWPGPSLS